MTPNRSHYRAVARCAPTGRRYLRGAGRGFTIVEMLIVVGIIALLMGILLPSLSGVQTRSRKMTETNNIRQVGMAWNMYASQHNSAALPGYLDFENGPPELTSVREAWRVRYEYPAPPQGGTGPNGLDPTIPDEVSAPWTWRLAQYLDYSPEVLWGYRDEVGNNLVSILGEPQAQHVALANEPAFGYNAYYVGGWWQVTTESTEEGPITRARFSFWDAEKDGKPVNHVVRSVANVAQPHNLIVFCSSTEFEDTGPQPHVFDDTVGSHLVTPPTLGPDAQWHVGGGVSSNRGEFAVTTSDRDTVNALDSPIHAPLGRHNRRPAILFADGSTTAETLSAIADQRRWIDGVTDRNYTHQGTYWVP